MFKIILTFLIIFCVIGNVVFIFRRLSTTQQIKLTKYVGWGIIYSCLTLAVMFFIVQLF